MVADHEIFQKPFPVQLTLEEIETPSSYRSYYDGKDLPAKIATWRVQTELGEKNYGLVSDPYSFADSPDSEWIASGVNSKGPRSAAIARQGNWFLWGFCADPTEMTDEAQKVFLNSIVYIDKFDGQRPFFNKESRGREWALNAAHFLADERLAQYGRQNLASAFFELAGGDDAKMLAVVTENLGYIRLEGEQYTLDEDCRALGIANNDVALLDRCVALLEEQQDVERASRLLRRYTDQELSSAAEWRRWLDAKRANLYFTDTGGYRFRVNEVPVGLRPDPSRTRSGNFPAAAAGKPVSKASGASKGEESP